MEESSPVQKHRLRRSERQKAEARWREAATLVNQLGALVGTRARFTLGFSDDYRVPTAKEIREALARNPDLALRVQSLLQQLAEAWRPYLQGREQALVGLRNKDPGNLARLFFIFNDVLVDNPDIERELSLLHRLQRADRQAQECLGEVQRGRTTPGSGRQRQQTQEGRQLLAQQRKQEFDRRTRLGQELIQEVITNEYDRIPASKMGQDWRAIRQQITNQVLDGALNAKAALIRRAARKRRNLEKSAN